MAARSKKVPSVKLKRLKVQTRILAVANRLVLSSLGLILGLAVVASALPQRRQLKVLEGQLALTLEEEKRVLAEKEYREIEYKALREDPRFLELKAMDRLNLHHRGETVYRIRRDGN